VEFDHTAEQERLVFDLIEERASRPPWQRLLGEFLCGNVSFDEYMRLTEDQRRRRTRSEVPERLVQRPSADHDSMKAAVRARYLAPPLAAWRERADASYRAALATAD
jgi:hypothetical protein